jgi:hypothetical protein
MLEKIDFNEIARNIIKNKLISEKVEKAGVFAVKEEFDIYDYLPKVQLDGSTLKKQASKNLDTRLLESMFANLRGATLAETVANFNNALGIVTDAEGFKSFAGVAPEADATQVFDALTILGALRTILSFEPTAAGTMFEKMVAGLFGGFHMGGQNAFADVVVDKPEDKKELVSVKLLKEDGVVGGSGIALAINVAQAGDNPVTFFVGIKSKDVDPYVVRFLQFSINRDNYFKFMGYEGREQALIELLKEKIYVKLTVTEDGVARKIKTNLNYWQRQYAAVVDNTDERQNQKFRETGLVDSQTFFDALAYFADANAIWISGTKDEEAPADEKTKKEKDGQDTDPVMRLLSPIIITTKTASSLQTSIQHFYKAITVPGFENGINGMLSDIRDGLQRLKTYPAEYWSDGTERYLNYYYGVTREQLQQLKSMDVLVSLLRMKSMPNTEEIPKAKGSDFPWAAESGRSPSSPVRDILVGNPTGGRKGFKDVWNRLNTLSGGAFKPVLEEYLKFRDGVVPNLEQYMTSMNEEEKGFYTQLFGAGTTQQKLDTVKNNLLGPKPELVALASRIPVNEVPRLDEAAGAKKAADNQKTGHNITRPISHILENAEAYDVKRDIPAIFLDKKLIGSNSDGYSDNLLKRYTPVFRQFHNIRVGLLKYYSGGYVSGLTDAKDSTSGLSTEIDNMLGNKQMMSQNKPEPEVQAESKNRLTNSNIDAILDEL